MRAANDRQPQGTKSDRTAVSRKAGRPITLSDLPGPVRELIGVLDPDAARAVGSMLTREIALAEALDLPDHVAALARVRLAFARFCSWILTYEGVTR